MLHRWMGALCCALVYGTAFADSVSGPAQLAASADCQTTADVQWSLTYTQNPVREFGRVTIPDGSVIGMYDQPAGPLLTGGSFSGRWQQFITRPQTTPNTLIGSYGGAGDNPPTAAHTVEFFVLYNCTTRQVLYRCSGNLGTCPTTAIQALLRTSEPIPATSSGSLAALLLATFTTGAYMLRRRVA